MATNDKPTKPSPWRLFFWIGLLILALVVAWGVYSQAWLGGSEEAAKFGDAFGTLNALFSGLAFAGVIIAILLQRRELKLQRKELRRTRKQLRRTAAAQEKSEQALLAETEAQTRAYLKITLEHENQRNSLLVVANVGRTPADDVRLKVDRAVYARAVDQGLKVVDLSSLPLFSTGGFTLSPGTRLVYSLIAPGPVATKEPNPGWVQPAMLTVSAHFRSRSGQALDEETVLSWDLQAGTWPDHEEGAIGQVTKGLRKLVEH